MCRSPVMQLNKFGLCRKPPNVPLVGHILADTRGFWSEAISRSRRDSQTPLAGQAMASVIRT